MRTPSRFLRYISQLLFKGEGIVIVTVPSSDMPGPSTAVSPASVVDDVESGYLARLHQAMAVEFERLVR